ncbi:MAG: NADH-quinone oxidoreductase subunit J [Coriobacteriia bacterium]|nr:NADH-quinone oxidoreductase subunit J [Coriobacteriia bacterium]
MTDTLTLVAFGLLAFACLAGAVGMITARNVVHAAYCLLAVSVAAAGLFALLEARYIALMQVLVYAGAVAILNLFTIMITLRRREDAVRPRDFSWAGLALAVTFFAVVVAAVAGGTVRQSPDPEVFPGILEFGEKLFALDGWVLPFEIASLILTAALVGAVWWSREGEE